jgi:hypothetical protein
MLFSKGVCAAYQSCAFEHVILYTSNMHQVPYLVGKRAFASQREHPRLVPPVYPPYTPSPLSFDGQRGPPVYSQCERDGQPEQADLTITSPPLSPFESFLICPPPFGVNSAGRQYNLSVNVTDNLGMSNRAGVQVLVLRSALVAVIAGGDRAVGDCGGFIGGSRLWGFVGECLGGIRSALVAVIAGGDLAVRRSVGDCRGLSGIVGLWDPRPISGCRPTRSTPYRRRPLRLPTCPKRSSPAQITPPRHSPITIMGLNVTTSVGLPYVFPMKPNPQPLSNRSARPSLITIASVTVMIIVKA